MDGLTSIDSTLFVFTPNMKFVNRLKGSLVGNGEGSTEFHAALMNDLNIGCNTRGIPWEYAIKILSQCPKENVLRYLNINSNFALISFEFQVSPIVLLWFSW